VRAASDGSSHVARIAGPVADRDDDKTNWLMDGASRRVQTHFPRKRDASSGPAHLHVAGSPAQTRCPRSCSGPKLLRSVRRCDHARMCRPPPSKAHSARKHSSAAHAAGTSLRPHFYFKAPFYYSILRQRRWVRARAQPAVRAVQADRSAVASPSILRFCCAAF